VPLDLKTVYASGYDQALLAVFLKEADLKSFAQKFAITSALIGGAAGGGRAVGGWASKAMSGKAATAAAELLEHRRDAGKFVDADAFLAKFAPKIKRQSIEDFADFVARDAKTKNPDLKGIRTSDLANELLKTPDFRDYKAGTNAGFIKNFGVASSRKADPSVLAHEAIGHGSQSNLNPASDNSFFSILTGKQKGIEQDAWDRARRSYKVDSEVEDASMNYYRNAHAGAVGGGVAGAGAGAGGTGLGLMGLSSLLARLKKAPKRKK